jgi:DNA-binding MarR family transcriptional regulator
VLRDEDDLQLLAELGGVLDETVSAAGLSAGSYLVLRELVAHPGPNPVTELAGRLSASPDEVAGLCSRLVDLHLARVQASGVEITETGVERAATLEERANEAMRSYVIERPHTATVYGLVASMQSGRFTVEDLLAFLAEGPTTEDDAQ